MGFYGIKVRRTPSPPLLIKKARQVAGLFYLWWSKEGDESSVPRPRLCALSNKTHNPELDVHRRRKYGERK